MNEKDEESERDADYKEWNYWQEQMNEKDEESEKDRVQLEKLYSQARHQAVRLKIKALPPFTSSFSCSRASSPCPASSPSPW